jgi:hypothetical protein
MNAPPAPELTPRLQARQPVYHRSIVTPARPAPIAIREVPDDASMAITGSMLRNADPVVREGRRASALSQLTLAVREGSNELGPCNICGATLSPKDAIARVRLVAGGSPKQVHRTCYWDGI